MSYSKKVLEALTTLDNATLNTDLPPLKKEAKIPFRCKCGENDIKTFVRIKVSGVLCKKCTDIQKRERREATNLAKYGTTCTLQNEEIKAKSAATCLAKYKTVNALSSRTN